MTDQAAPMVLIVDDDASLREALTNLFASVGLAAQAFASGADLLRTKPYDGPSCLVLDVRLPGLSGLDLQAELAKADMLAPIIFVTGHGDIPMSVRAMKAGAVEFLTKPLHDQQLLDAVQRAIEQDRARREEQKAMGALRARFEALTAREQEVMALVVAGQLNKQIAHALGVSEITVKVHRANVMRKVGAGSLAELVSMANRIKFAVPKQ
jgi:FixJ family two-component response regulator